MMIISYAVSSPIKQSIDSQNDSLSLLSTSSVRPLRSNKDVFSRSDNKTGKKKLKTQRNKISKLKIRQFGAPHHESPYCYNYVPRQNLDVLKSRPRLVAMVQALQKEVKSLQRLYLVSYSCTCVLYSSLN